MRPNLKYLPQATVVAVLLASTTLLAPAAHALPVFTEADMDGGTGASEESATDCAENESSTPSVSNVPVAENGAATTVAQNGSGTYTNNGDNTDTLQFSTAMTGVGKVASGGANPIAFELVGDGSVSATASKPVAGCFASASTFVDLDYTFTVAQAGFLTVTTQGSKYTYGEFYLEDDVTNTTEFQLVGSGNRFSEVGTVYLPPGTYTGDLRAYAWLSTDKTIPSTPVKVSIHAEFDVAGSQTAAPVGKASKYVALPGARSCATDSLDATVTPKKNRAAKIKQIKFFVNDKAAAKVKTPKKGAVVKVPVVDDVEADLRAVVTEVKKKNGKPGKVYEVEASYAPCS